MSDTDKLTTVELTDMNEQETTAEPHPHRPQKQSPTNRLLDFLSMIFGVEFSVFLFYIGGALYGPATQSFVYSEICLYNLKSAEKCAVLNQLPELAAEESLVQSQFALYTTYAIIFSLVPTIFVILILGSWCDRLSFKVLLILPHAAQIISCTALILYASFPDSKFDPTLLGLCYIPGGLAGGNGGLIVACASYIGRTTTSDNRTVRLGILEAALTLGTLIGYVASAFLLNSLSPVISFVIVGSISVYALGIVIFLIPELHKFADVKKRVLLEAGGSWLRYIFWPNKEIFGAFFIFFGRSQNYAPVRKYLVVMLATYAPFVAMVGDSLLFGYFAMNPISMSASVFAIYSAVGALLTTMSLVLGLRAFRKFFNMSDASLMVVAIIFRLISLVWISMAPFYPEVAPWLYAVLNMFAFFVGLSVRSAITKLIDHSEQGRVFSFLSLFDTCLGLAVSTALNSLYGALVAQTYSSETLNYFVRGYTFMFEAALMVPLLLLAIWLGRQDIKNWSFRYGARHAEDEKDD